MKRRIAAMITAALFLSAALLSGCRSMIELRLLDEAERSVPVEMSIDDFYSEKDGYHFPGLSWGSDFKAFQQATNFSVKEIEGYTDNGESVYTAGLHYIVLDRENDGGNVGCKGKQDVVSFVSMSFQEDPDTVETPTLNAYYEKLIGKLEETYGKADEFAEHTEIIDNASYQYASSFWRKAIGEQITELQISRVTPTGATEASIVSIGFAWYEESDETKDE